MILTDTMPTVCPHCQTEIPASTYAEDFYAGAEIVCTGCQAQFRYFPTGAVTYMKRAETPAPDEKRCFV